MSNSDYRKYMGRHVVFLTARYGKKAIVTHCEDGYVGNKECGYKKVKYKDTDIVLIRHCWRIKK